MGYNPGFSGSQLFTLSRIHRCVWCKQKAHGSVGVSPVTAELNLPRL